MTQHELAMKMIPVLIHWAKYSWKAPHYYSDLSKAIGHNSSQIGGVLGVIHNIIEELAQNNNCQIPTLNSLVISKSTKRPSYGFSYVHTEYKGMTKEEQEDKAESDRQEAHEYDWSWVLDALNLAPIVIVDEVFDSDLIDDNADSFIEGAKRQVTVNSYERDQKARLQCIKIHGAVCSVCGLDFEKKYGEIGKGFIHVHHIVPIHTIGKGYKVNPAKDLVPVCPNCHAMLHRGLNADARTIEELTALLKD